MTRRTPAQLAKRFEQARAGLGIETQDAMSALIFPGDPKRRTRYNTILRTLQKGGTPQWKDLGPLVAFFAERGYHLAWLLYGQGPPNTMVSQRQLELMAEPTTPPTGVRLRRPAR